MGVENILEIRGLTKSFGEKKVLCGLSLTVPKGSIFGFVGRNGAGKTTAMKAVLGLLKPDSGEIFVAGELVRYGETVTNKYIGYLPDVPEFYPFMTPTEYLELCGECGKYIYTANVPMPEDGRCVKCGAYLGQGCLEVARGRLDNGNSLCGACMDSLKNQDLRKHFYENLKLKTEYEYTDMRLSSIRKYLESALYILPFIERHKEFIKRHMGILAAIKFGSAVAELKGGIAFRLKDETLLDKPDPCAAELEYRLDVRVGRACRRFIIKADAMLSQIENGACQVDITRERVVYGG